MALKNPQYNAIIRQYDRRQLENNHLHDMRLQEIYEKIPAYAALDDQLAQTGADFARQAVLAPGTQSKDALRQKMNALEEEKTSLLTAHGYPADYLAPHYHCPDCKDTGFIGNKKCHCFFQAVVDLVYAQSNIRQRLSEDNFDTFCLDYYPDTIDKRLGISPREHMQSVLSVCHEFIEYFDTSCENLFLYGVTGVGKTFLSHCIAKALLDTAHTVIYLTAFELVDILESNTFGADDDNDIPENMFNYVLDCDLLIIDDLGTELNNSFVSSQLFLCINERLMRQKSTIISTNLSLDQLQKEYSERIFSRIISNYKVLPVLGDDIRVKKALMT